MKYEIIIGLEIHAELKTKSKMFCSCNNNSENSKPNTNICPICLAHPGTLPIPNKQAIEWLILLGCGLNCKVNQFSKFDRKNYFYPDIPKGYQISQYDIPFVYNGYLEIENQKIKITRIHMEEDTGKSRHPNKKNYSLIDFNRAGTPLIELVTEPVIKNANIAKKFCQRYQQVLRYLEISDADMEKGQMRCEANVSIQEEGKWEYNGNCEITPLGKYKLNPKVELKNINSFKAIEKAIEYEINRQKNALDSGKKLIQETRGWDNNKGKTITQRIKESAADYRYFPDPDIPPITISDKWLKEIKTNLIELPHKKKKRFMEQYNFNDETAEILISDKNLAKYTEQVISELREWIETNGDDWESQRRQLAQTTSNWLASKLFKYLKEDKIKITDIKITPENFAELIALVHQGKINSNTGQKILEIMYKQGGDPTDIMKSLGLEQIDNDEELKKIIKKIIKNNQSQVEQYRNGKINVLQYFVGQTMKETQGKANPPKVIKILKEILK